MRYNPRWMIVLCGLHGYVIDVALMRAPPVQAYSDELATAHNCCVFLCAEQLRETIDSPSMF